MNLVHTVNDAQRRGSEIILSASLESNGSHPSKRSEESGSCEEIVPTALRSKLARQFKRMNELHDRIRAKLLTARSGREVEKQQASRFNY